MSNKAINFQKGNVSGKVSLLGAMVGPVQFRFSNDKVIQPFSIAPWANKEESKNDKLPPILKNLGGEWPCVPFGTPGTRRDLPPEWLRNIESVESVNEAFMHGFSSNHEWQDISKSSQEAELSIEYPLKHPVKGLNRKISVTDNNQLEFELLVETEQPVELPIGLHGTFKLPNKPGKAKLMIDSFKGAYTYPVTVEPGISILKPNQKIEDLEQVLRLDGRVENMTTLPLESVTEELILLDLSEGRIRLQNYDEGYEVVFEWNIEQFPSCLLWYSNKGRDYYPWNKRFQAMGIEPIASAFDLGVVHSRNASSPLREVGIKTGFRLEGEDRFSYRISVNEI
ncbi:hypothetical protein MUS1_04385 [Marinomonas ushuaiensis DSM 15871]|uniref:Aldose 1-epimerase n=1 Tax=Marinomonas ushuaiensis DSM 15871 TaxID=1122207 RepID=X7E221_9GAMM|nr:hypothetical protein [Marinomonas ushuaiensis]ETX10124.1 hypothetical protein MUS1_04385 [Marinomonas ushuaiensis DSM 15871]